MAFLIGGANSAADTGYDVDNSCRFDTGGTAEMHKTPGGAGNLDAWTFSCWVKRSRVGAGSTQSIYGVFADSNNQETLAFDSGGNVDKLYWQLYQGGAIKGQLTTNRLFRDVSAWYNIVVSYDSANGTAGNRMRMWINGTEETSFATDTNPSSGQDSQWNGTTKHQIGCITTANHFDGYMAEVVSLDGTAVTDASDFGEFDEDSPNIWKPKDVSGLTFGTNGFYLDFEDSSNLGNDKNGGTDLTEVNIAAADQASDSPTNNFATFNPLIPQAEITYSEGNCIATDTGTGGNSRTALSTIAPSSGKWYAEFKLITDGGDYPNIGIWASDVAYVDTNNVGLPAHTWSYLNSSSGRVISGNSTVGGTSLGTYAEDDIIGIALDLDNDFLYFHKNGTYINSGDPTTGATGTGGYAVTAGRDYFFATTTNTNGAWGANFGGCPGFAISSGNADDNNYGNFEYDVPAGYYALNTQNLAEFGG